MSVYSSRSVCQSVRSLSQKSHTSKLPVKFSVHGQWLNRLSVSVRRPMSVSSTPLVCSSVSLSRMYLKNPCTRPNTKHAVWSVDPGYGHKKIVNNSATTAEESCSSKLSRTEKETSRCKLYTQPGTLDSHNSDF